MTKTKEGFKARVVYALDGESLRVIWLDLRAGLSWPTTVRLAGIEACNDNVVETPLQHLSCLAAGRLVTVFPTKRQPDPYRTIARVRVEPIWLEQQMLDDCHARRMRKPYVCNNWA